MTGGELQAWRKQAGWTQTTLAGQLHLTLDKVKNWESDRTAIPDEIAAVILSWDIPTPGNKLPAYPKCLDSRGDPIDGEKLEDAPLKTTYYRFPWKDPAGHLWYGMWQVQLSRGELVHRCTDICLDTTAWRHHWDMRPVDPAFMRHNLDVLDRRMAHRRTATTPASRYNSAMECLDEPRSAVEPGEPPQ